VNSLRQTAGIGEGMIVTTGSYTGMLLAPSDCKVSAGFVGFGEVACRLE
jgi:2-keto-4-pentenoate hydratase